MSLILEALRKSEAERRRGLTPDVLADMPTAQPPNNRRSQAWAWVLPVLAMLAIAYWVSKRNAAPPPPAAPTATTMPAGDGPTRRQPAPAAALPPVPRLTAPTPAPAAAATPPQQAPADAEVVDKVAQSVPKPRSPAQASPAAPRAPAVIPPTSPVPATVDNPPPPATPTATTAPGDGRIESLSDLSVADRQSLPPLKLSMHLWNPDPAKRFVILDGNRIAEGDRVGDAVVRAITRDGVLLEWRGRQLQLSMH